MYYGPASQLIALKAGCAANFTVIVVCVTYTCPTCLAVSLSSLHAAMLALHVCTQFCYSSMGCMQVNQLPGSGWFTSKWTLSQNSFDYDFLPKTFQLPAKKAEFDK